MQEPFAYDRPCDPPFEFVPVEATGEQSIPERFREQVVILTLHDGEAIPKFARFDPEGRPRVDPEHLAERFVSERDWGANLVAHKIAAALGIPGYARVCYARVLADFNRFPGSTPPDHADALSRLAIIPPFNTALDHASKMRVLRDYYDATSDIVERHFLTDKRILLCIHTYDEHNPSLTRRPDLSLVSVPQTYQREARMPYGLFDPIFPDELAESTCCRILRDRISLNLERSGFRVTHNHPYPATDGSFEVRSQVWHFFRQLRVRFEEVYPETRGQEPFLRVWRMLLNTNLRDHEAEALRSYLHRFRKIAGDKQEPFRRARDAYSQVMRFLDNRDAQADFDHYHDRPSSLGLEVRKDLLCELNPETGRPIRRSPGQEEVATMIGNVIAGALKTYFETDREFF